MADIVITIAAALALGLLAHELRIPPLVGFLAAGFGLHAFGFTAFAGLQEISDLGVVLLLFTIGLKFDLRSLLQPEAHGTAALHMITVVLLGAGTIGAAAAIGLVTAYLLTRQSFAGKNAFEFGTMLSFAIPGTVIGVTGGKPVF